MDRALPLMGIYLNGKKKLTKKPTYTLMLIAALLTIVKTWKRPKWPSMHGWIKM